MSGAEIDQIQLHLNTTGLAIINAAIALMMFGVALDIKVEDFSRILRSPRAPIAGLVAQFVLLPAATFGITQLIHLHPSVALGMILVAACPGGNLSNLVTWLACGNAAVSVTMTAISSAAAVVMTPLNLSLWGGLDPGTAAVLQSVSLDPAEVFLTVFVVLGVPLALGMIVGKTRPAFAARVRRGFKIATVVLFMIVILGALAANWSIFLAVIGVVIGVVAVHNACALALGYAAGRLARLPRADTRAVTVEVGIQNSALGLVLVFGFFDGLGGMAIIVAWWGVWHIIAGLSLAAFWGRRPAEA